LAYGATALMMYFLKPRLTTIITVLILILYWPVMVYFGDSADPLSMQGNAVLRLDNWLIGTKHLYTGEGFPFDPEGLLSTLPSIGNVVAGYLVGSYLQKSGKSYEGLAKLLMVGVLCFIISYWWNLGFPINKKLWSSSFVMRTVGLDCMILACIIYLIDFLGKTKSVYFFQVFGRNPLPIYLLSEIGLIILFIIPVGQLSLFQWVYQNIFIYAGNYFASLLFAISWMLFCWVAGYILDKKKIYIKV
jgi:predicted acyltransferase